MINKQYQGEEPKEQEINFLEILQLLVKRRVFIGAICLITALGSVIYTLTLPNTYSASAKVLPPQKETGGGLSALLGQASGGLAGLAGGGLGGNVDLFLGILKSRSVGDAVIQKLNLINDYKTGTIEATRPIINKSVSGQSGTDGIITITAIHKDPRQAAIIANAFASELGRATVRLNLAKASNEKIFLEKRLDVVKGELKAAEDDLKQFSQKNKIVQMDSQTKASFEATARMTGELASRELQLSVLRESLTDESSEVKTLRAGIQKLRGQLARLEGAGGGVEGLPALGNIPGLGLEYLRKMREFKTREAVFEQLSKQYEIAKLNEAKDASTFQIIDEAIPSVTKVGPKRGRMVILATIVALFAAVLIVVIRDRFENMSADSRNTYNTLKKQLLSFR